ncbi:MAG TPA: hypothetical protein VMZ28_23945, partial [Kofleriaceae bacterium]|nr:hypothetical protein [Kofleriaceae bacterium]
SARARLDRARAAALGGDFAPARELATERAPVERATQASLVARWALWDGDAAAWEALIPPASEVDPLARGDMAAAVLAVLRDGAVPAWVDERMHELVATHGTSVRFSSLLHQLAAEVHAVGGEVPASLDWIAGGIQVGLIDLMWLEHCPALARARAAPRYAELRATLEARTVPIRAALDREVAG